MFQKVFQNGFAKDGKRKNFFIHKIKRESKTKLISIKIDSRCFYFWKLLGNKKFMPTFSSKYAGFLSIYAGN